VRADNASVQLDSEDTARGTPRRTRPYVHLMRACVARRVIAPLVAALPIYLPTYLPTYLTQNQAPPRAPSFSSHWTRATRSTHQLFLTTTPPPALRLAFPSLVTPLFLLPPLLLLLLLAPLLPALIPAPGSPISSPEPGPRPFRHLYDPRASFSDQRSIDPRETQVPVSFSPRIEHSILFRYLRAVKSPLPVPLPPARTQMPVRVL